VHDNDLVINVTKSRKLTNMRASGADDKARIVPPIIFSLEEALEYIKEDEYVEVTPKSMRMRKIILDESSASVPTAAKEGPPPIPLQKRGNCK
jgi:GTP-binding protein